MSRKKLKRTALVLEDLEPALWGTLAPRLLNHVFLRLPVSQISQLRLLSKLWNATIDSVESEFNLLLEDKVYPNLFGIIGGQESRWGDSSLWMFDVNQDRWCIRDIDPSVRGQYVGAADGGLVCLFSDSTEDPLTIVVMNPLTGKKVELPRLLCIHDVLPTIKPSMLQLRMNHKNNHYQVFFVGYIQSGNRGLVAQVYDSRTKDWRIVGPREKSWGRISGHWYAWEDEDLDRYDGERQGPCLYDFAQGQLHRYEAYKILRVFLRGRLVMSYAMLRDRLFILHMQREKRGRPSNLIQKDPTKQKYFISEYHLQRNGAFEVEGETHGCEPFDDYPQGDWCFSLHACNGCLMVLAYYCAFGPRGPDFTDAKYEHDIVWLYNLSTYKWRVLPKVLDIAHWCVEKVLMCELRWNATP